MTFLGAPLGPVEQGVARYAWSELRDGQLSRLVTITGSVVSQAAWDEAPPRGEIVLPWEGIHDVPEADLVADRISSDAFEVVWRWARPSELHESHGSVDAPGATREWLGALVGLELPDLLWCWYEFIGEEPTRAVLLRGRAEAYGPADPIELGDRREQAAEVLVDPEISDRRSTVTEEAFEALWRWALWFRKAPDPD